jgi:hypothetical protein
MWIKILSIIIINFVMYWRTLKYGFIIDDDAVAMRTSRAVCNNGYPVDLNIGNISEDNQKVIMPVLKQVTDNFLFHPKKSFMTRSFLRDVWNHFFGDLYLYPGLAHFMNLFVHCVNSVLIYLAFGQNEVSFIAAILFAINPVNNQVSIWLSGRTYSIATMLLLTGILFKPALPFLFAVALYRCVAILPAPIVLFFTPYWMFALPLPFIGYLLRNRYLGTIAMRWATVPDDMKKITPMKSIIALKTLGYYLMHSLFPMNLGMCHTYMHNMGMSPEETKPCYKIDKFFFVGLAFILALITALILGYKDNVFGLIWYLVFIFPWLNIILLNHPISERYTYMANIGLMLFVASMIVAYPVLVGILIGWYGIRLWTFMPAYKDCLHFWQSNVDNFPEGTLGYNQLGIEKSEQGKTGSAFDIWQAGLNLRPNDFRLNYNIANMLSNVGRFEGIKEYIVKAEQNLLPRNDYDTWKERINLIKEAAKQNGIQFDN